MADESKIPLVISAQNLATGTLGAANKQVTKLGAAVDDMQKHWLKAAAVVLAARKAWDFAEAAAKVDQQAQAFTNLAASHGADANSIIKNLKKTSGQTISTANVMASAGKAMLLGIPADKLESMMEIARAASRITGETVQKSFDDIATGMGRQSKLILDNLGIIVSVEKANKAYAAELGIVGRALTDAEKTQAFHNATMAAGEDIVRRVGVQGMTAAESMAMFQAKLADVAIVVGKVLITIASFVSGGLIAISAGFTDIIGLAADLFGWFLKLGRFIPDFSNDVLKVTLGSDLVDAAAKMADLSAASRFAANELRDQAIVAGDVGTSIWKEKKALDAVIPRKQDYANVTNEQTAAQKELDALNKSINADIEKMTDEYTRLTTTEQEYINLKASDMIRKGAEVDLVNTWLDAHKQVMDQKEREIEIENQRLAQQRLAALEGDSPFGPQGGGTELEAIVMGYNDRLIALQDFNASVIMEMDASGATEAEIVNKYSDLKKQYAQSESNLRIQTAGETAGMLANTSQNLFVAMGSTSKKMFKVGQGLAMAETAINTYSAAMGAYKALAPIPFIGPGLGVAAAAAAIAAGAARMREIKSTKLGGGSISKGGTASASFKGGSASAGPVPQRLERLPEDRSKQTIQIAIHNPLSEQNWAKIAEENIAPALNDAGNRNVEVRVTNREERSTDVA